MLQTRRRKKAARKRSAREAKAAERLKKQEARKTGSGSPAPAP
jgi:hypothetical protein